MPERYEANIRMLPLFAKLPPQYLTWAREAMRVMRFEPGEAIFQQGEEAAGLYLFLSGSARLIQRDSSGRNRVIGQINANQYINESALFRRGTETATLETVQQANVLFVSRQRLWRVVSYHPEMKDYLPVPEEALRTQQRERIFQGQRDSEEVLLDTRRHWWAFVRQGWFPGLLALALLIASGVSPVAGLSLVLGGLGIILPGAIMIYLYLEWRNDHIIVTDQRVIRIERVIHNLQEQRSEVPLTSIQQINADIVTSDPFSRLFNYGTVDIRTAGDAGNLSLTLMPRPNATQDLIFENRNRYREQAERERKNTIRAEVDKVLTQGGDRVPDPQPAVRETAHITHTPHGLLPMKFTNAKGATVYRKHVFHWARHVFLPVVILIGALIFFFFAGELGAIGYVIDIALFIVGGLWFWWADWDWRNDMYIVGDEMIQIIHKRPLFLQNEDDQILLDRVDNVTATRNGLIPTLFNYGIVRIALVGGDRGDEKYFRAVPSPAEVQEEITRRQQRWRSRQEHGQERQRREEIAEYLSAYHDMMQEQQNAPSTQPDNVNAPGRGNLRPPNVPRRRN
jgi:uncharacterized membrane protein YdbT with pleckstrin-like domain